MTNDGRYVGVVDRIEDDLAVVLLEECEGVADELVVPASDLPEEARHSDAVLGVSVRDDSLVSAEYDPEETERRSAAAQARFDALAKRPGEESGDEGESEADDGRGDDSAEDEC